MTRLKYSGKTKTGLMNCDKNIVHTVGLIRKTRNVISCASSVRSCHSERLACRDTLFPNCEIRKTPALFGCFPSVTHGVCSGLCHMFGAVEACWDVCMVYLLGFLRLYLLYFFRDNAWHNYLFIALFIVRFQRQRMT